MVGENCTQTLLITGDHHISRDIWSHYNRTSAIQAQSSRQVAKISRLSPKLYGFGHSYYQYHVTYHRCHSDPKLNTIPKQLAEI